VEDLHHLRVLEQGDEVAERELTPDEVSLLQPLMEEAARMPAPIIVEPQAGGPDGMAVSLAFEDEEAPRVRLAADRLPAKGAGWPYDKLMAELDALLTQELHVKAPRRAHLVLPHMLRAEE
jgi:hypothetical protein